MMKKRAQAQARALSFIMSIGVLGEAADFEKHLGRLNGLKKSVR